LTWNSFSHSVFYAVDDIHLITDIEPCPAGQVELSTHSAQSTNQTSFNLLPSDERIDLISAQPTDTNNLKGHNTQAHWPFSQTTAPLDCTDNFRFLAFSAGLPLNFLQFQNFSPGRIQPDFISFLLAFSAGSLLNRIETLTHRTANTRNIINFIFLQLSLFWRVAPLTICNIDFRPFHHCLDLFYKQVHSAIQLPSFFTSEGQHSFYEIAELF
jgi:hypothetical protein